MLRIERTQRTAEPAADYVRRPVANPTAGQVANDADAAPKLASVALVPAAPMLRAAPASSPSSRPDSSFLAHLIATAEQAPQTRRLRRAEPQEALTAYAAQQSMQQTGRQTRQVA